MPHDQDEDHDDDSAEARNFEVRAHALAMAVDLNRGRMSPATTIAEDAQVFANFLEGNTPNVRSN